MSAPVWKPSLDDYITLAQAAKFVAGRRKRNRASKETIKDWVKRGSHGIYLKAVQIGGQACTTQRWLHEFILECTRYRRNKANTRRWVRPQDGPDGYTVAADYLSQPGEHDVDPIPAIQARENPSPPDVLDHQEAGAMAVEKLDSAGNDYGA